MSQSLRMLQWASCVSLVTTAQIYLITTLWQSPSSLKVMSWSASQDDAMPSWQSLELCMSFIRGWFNINAIDKNSSSKSYCTFLSYFVLHKKKHFLKKKKINVNCLHLIFYFVAVLSKLLFFYSGIKNES